MTLYSYAKLLPLAKSYFNNDVVATAVVVGGTFIGTLLVVSIITVRFSDMVLDSRVGALDRTMGFMFGLGAVSSLWWWRFCFLPGWCRNAASRNGCAAPSRGWCCRGRANG